MARTVISVENISKQYRLGAVSTGTISHDVNRWWHAIRGKQDPYLKIGEINDRTERGASDYVWALKDVSFEVKHGEVLGIIGCNGAGKSTLLKILSRTTAPTTGRIKIKGRVASLLEVGTGFHPELTGRDNIYLNGTILGMSRAEITRKFDEIVDFAGVERYIDTPVKRYSSGMYVRLAFAVAAHLEPEILIVDEVLAVGDAEFQKKAMGKMKSVSVNGQRTVLFVSHNLTAVKNLCSRTICLKNGQVRFDGLSELGVNYYTKLNFSERYETLWESPSQAPGNNLIRFRSVKLAFKGSSHLTVRTSFTIIIEFWNYIENREINLSLHFYSVANELIFNCVSQIKLLKKGLCKGMCEIPGNLLNDGAYYVSVMAVEETTKMIYNLENVISFDVADERDIQRWHGRWAGHVRPMLSFTLDNLKIV